MSNSAYHAYPKYRPWYTRHTTLCLLGFAVLISGGTIAVTLQRGWGAYLALLVMMVIPLSLGIDVLLAYRMTEDAHKRHHLNQPFEIAHAQTWVDHACRLYSIDPIQVTPWGRKHAGRWDNESHIIWISNDDWLHPVVLAHEFTHALLPYAGHDREFRRTLAEVFDRTGLTQQIQEQKRSSQSGSTPNIS